MTENEIQREILDALSLIPGVCAWRNNTGVSRSGGRYVRFGIAGQGDITGLLRGGRRLEIEVKTAKGKVSPEQVAFGESITSKGGLYIVARCVEDALAAIRAALVEAPNSEVQR
jgi:hypothetical protein